MLSCIWILIIFIPIPFRFDYNVCTVQLQCWRPTFRKSCRIPTTQHSHLPSAQLTSHLSQSIPKKNETKHTQSPIAMLRQLIGLILCVTIDGLPSEPDNGQATSRKLLFLDIPLYALATIYAVILHTTHHAAREGYKAGRQGNPMSVNTPIYPDAYIREYARGMGRRHGTFGWPIPARNYWVYEDLARECQKGYASGLGSRDKSNAQRRNPNITPQREYNEGYDLMRFDD